MTPTLYNVQQGMAARFSCAGCSKPVEVSEVTCGDCCMRNAQPAIREKGEVWRPMPDPFRGRACGACLRPLVWVPGNPRKCNGTPTSIPLDLTTVRATDGSRYGVQRTVFEARSHFQTCPEPGKFSKKGG